MESQSTTCSSQSTSKTYYQVSPIPLIVWNSLRSREHLANTILPVMLKARERESAGHPSDGHVCITVGCSHVVEFVLSVSAGNMGTYPVFIFTTFSNDDLTDAIIRPGIIMLVKELLTAVPKQRVYSVFAQELVAQIFADEWTRATSISQTPSEPYYAAMITYCTAPSLSARSKTTLPSPGQFLRLGTEDDLEGIGNLCFIFAADADPFILTRERAREEASILIRDKQVWVYAIPRDGQQDEIACIVALTRNSENVATVTKVVTNPSWRRRGCAESLVRHVCEHFLTVGGKERVALYVAHNNCPAVNLYNRVGFVGLDGEIVRGVESWLELGFDRSKVELGFW